VGVVVPFRRREEPRLRPEDRALLDRLRASLPAMWRGGWVVPGERGGLELQRNQRCLGIWNFESGGYVYRPIESGQVTLRAPTVDRAHDLTLGLLGPLPSLP